MSFYTESTDICAVSDGEAVPSSVAAERTSQLETPAPAHVEPDWGKPVWDDSDDNSGDTEFTTRYTLGRDALGSGGYAQVFKATHIETDTTVAVKRIDFAKWRVCNNGISKEQLEAEFLIHAKLKHPNVVRMHTVFKGSKFIFVILEMVQGGDLFDFLIQKAMHGVSEPAARNWFAQLVDGVEYCHRQNVVHRDLKPENILLSRFALDAQLKIADFGLAKLLNGQNMCRTACGTPQYMAPEVHFKSAGRGYGKAADLWGLGVILHVMLTVTMPFGGNDSNCNSQTLRQEIEAHANAPRDSGLMQGEVWDRQTDEVKSLIRGLLTCDVRHRFSIQDVREHAWMRIPDRATHGNSPGAKKPRRV